MRGRMLIVAAVLVGVVAVFLVNSRINALEEKANPPTRTFYRAAAPIAPGVTVGDAMTDAQRLLAVEKITEEFARAHPDAVDEYEIELAKRRTIVRPVPAGEFLRMSHLEPVSASEMSSRIPAGHLAIGVTVNQETSAGYLVAPGDLVDVYVATSRSDASQPGGVLVEAKKVAGGVHVLATGNSLRLEGGAPVRPRGEPYSSVVITAPPPEIEAILKARQVGKITLVLASTTAP